MRFLPLRPLRARTSVKHINILHLGIALFLVFAASVMAQTPAPAASVIPAHPPNAFIEPGVLPKTWMTGGPKCMEMPAWQVHEYNPNFFILRESGCIHYEKPFLYLIFG